MRSLEKQTHWLRTQHYTNLHSHAYKFIYTDEHTYMFTVSVQIYSQEITLAPKPSHT